MARQLIRLSNETTTRCYQGEERPAEILEQVESQIFKIAARDLRGGFQPALELAGAAYKEIGTFNLTFRKRITTFENQYKEYEE